jgi:hypothetical protein
MHPNVTEIMAEAWLHESAGGEIERLAGRAKRFVDDRRGFPLTLDRSPARREVCTL